MPHSEAGTTAFAPFRATRPATSKSCFASRGAPRPLNGRDIERAHNVCRGMYELLRTFGRNPVRDRTPRLGCALACICDSHLCRDGAAFGSGFRQ